MSETVCLQPLCACLKKCKPKGYSQGLMSLFSYICDRVYTSNYFVKDSEKSYQGQSQMLFFLVMNGTLLQHLWTNQAKFLTRSESYSSSIVYKIQKIRIKDERSMLFTRLNMGILRRQERVALASMVRSGRILN